MPKMSPPEQMGYRHRSVRGGAPLRWCLRMVVPVLSSVLPLGAGEEYAGYEGRWVEVVATAYSPHDAVDGDYHATKGDRWRYITADAKTDVRKVPYGIAVPNFGLKNTPVIPYGTKVIIPAGQGYLDGSRPTDRVFPVDDTGSGISRKTLRTGKTHIDLRYMHTEWALKWQTKAIKMFIITGPAPASIYKFRPEDDLFYDPYYKFPAVSKIDMPWGGGYQSQTPTR